ncbi:nitroreductase family deazaflavin-dependent oxidoreductase [Actinoplanes sp. NPDC049596]|uniref:nitroreductase family deazaflavin-dependent oxidoreductase n=1 Tax=unclassified Actinoplanes TaxID=2626549 RepID=UPI00343C74C5
MTDGVRVPPRWVVTTAWRVHRGLYRATGGRFGLRRPRPGREGLFRLTTVGRRSGLERSVILAYIVDGPAVVTLAMNGWGDGEPAWWLNLRASGTAYLRTPEGTRRVTGRAAAGAERDRLWERWRELDPKLDGYAALRKTETAVVILEDTAG